MDTPEPTYTLTRKELEAFVLAGWNKSGEGFNAEYSSWLSFPICIDTAYEVKLVLQELGKDQTK